MGWPHNIYTVQALGDCRDLTFDECGGDAPFDTLKNIGEAACQVILILNKIKFLKKIGKYYFHSFLPVILQWSL